MGGPKQLTAREGLQSQGSQAWRSPSVKWDGRVVGRLRDACETWEVRSSLLLSPTSPSYFSMLGHRPGCTVSFGVLVILRPQQEKAFHQPEFLSSRSAQH